MFRPRRLNPTTSRNNLWNGIEPLEERIAPASLLSGKSLTYTDVDGDKVTVTVSKSVFKSTNVNKIFKFDQGTVDHHTTLHQQLETIDLSALGKTAAHLNVTVTVKQGVGGDGLANVGYINGSSLDLGTVTVNGDLGRITAGDKVTSTPGLAKLMVASMGEEGTSTQASGGTLASLVSGALTSLTITGDLKGASISVGALQPGDGSIGQIEVGGSILGGGTEFSGSIRATGNIGPVHVGGDVKGGAGNNTGLIGTAGTMGTVHIDGSVMGGDGTGSGAVLSTLAMGAVTIGGEVVGGSSANTGNIGTASTLASITITGGIKGGGASFSGAVLSTGNMGAVMVGGDIAGGAGPSSGQVGSSGNIASITARNLIGGGGDNSGGVYAAGNIGDVTVTSLQAGQGSFSGSLSAAGTLGNVQVNGDVTGNIALSAGSIFSGGTMGTVSAADLITAEISSGGDMGDLTVTGAILTSTITASGDLGKISAGSNLIQISASQNGIDGSVFQAGGSIGDITSSGATAITGSGFNAYNNIGDISATGGIANSLFIAGLQLGADFATDVSGAGTTAFGFGGSVLNNHYNFGDASIGKVTVVTPAGSTAPAGISHTTFTAGVLFSTNGDGSDYTPGGNSAIGDITAPGGLDTVLLNSGSIGNTLVTAGQIVHSVLAANSSSGTGIGTVTVTHPAIPALRILISNSGPPPAVAHAIDSSTFISNAAIGTIDAESPGAGAAITNSKFRAASGFGDLTAISSDTVTAIDSSIFTTGGNVGKVSVTGAISASQILAGVDLGGNFAFVTAANGGASIGDVTVTGKVLSSDIIASVLPYSLKYTYGNELTLQDTNVGAGGSIGVVSIDTSEASPQVSVNAYNNSGEVHGIEAATIASATIGTNGAIAVPVDNGGSEILFGFGEQPPDEAVRQITFFGY